MPRDTALPTFRYYLFFLLFLPLLLQHLPAWKPRTAEPQRFRSQIPLAGGVSFAAFFAELFRTPARRSLETTSVDLTECTGDHSPPVDLLPAAAATVLHAVLHVVAVPCAGFSPDFFSPEIPRLAQEFRRRKFHRLLSISLAMFGIILPDALKRPARRRRRRRYIIYCAVQEQKKKERKKEGRRWKKTGDTLKKRLTDDPVRILNVTVRKCIAVVCISLIENCLPRVEFVIATF